MTVPRLYEPHRGWLARGQFRPSPWGKSITDMFKETLVTFSRGGTTKDLTGGYKGGAPVETLQLYCHVEIETELVGVGQSGLQNSAVNPLTRRYFLVMVDHADLVDPQDPPRIADWMAFTDPLGIARHMRIAKVDAPEGVLDHIEISSEDFN